MLRDSSSLRSYTPDEGRRIIIIIITIAIALTTAITLAIALNVIVLTMTFPRSPCERTPNEQGH